MMRISITAGGGRAAVLAVSIIALAGLIRADGGNKTTLAHHHGRVSIVLPLNGSLAVSRLETGHRGITWPGADGTEFLGAGGFFLHFRRAGGATYDIVSPESFEAVDIGQSARDLFEGCEGGKRYPHLGSDDDGDGAVDEDPLDGEDNDGDGLIDEDFAAVGDGMIVTRAVEPIAGIVIQQSSYTWNYGHVRDFIGFSTIVEYPEDARRSKKGIQDLTIALYSDFDVGDPEDEGRGSDDRFFYIGDSAEDAGKRTFELPVVSDRTPSASFAAVLVLGAAGPRGTRLATDGFIMQKLDSADSLWARFEGMETERRHTVRRGSAGTSGDRAEPPRELSVYGAVNGDRAVVHRIGAVPSMSPGDRVTVEWVLVFGRTQEALIKNVRRAIETYRGVTDAAGATGHWVVPARQAVRREFGVTLASVWSDGQRRPAAAMAVPADLESEEVEWIRVNGRCTALYERVGAKIVLPLENELVERAEPFSIEGQLTDGTIFTAEPGGELLRAYAKSGDLAPDRLPDDSMYMFPNPFLTSLTIDVIVPGPSAYANSTGGETQGTSSVRIYDVKGRLVRTVLQEEYLHPGSYQLGWDGQDENGAKVAPGVYYCKLQISARSLTKRVILLR